MPSAMLREVLLRMLAAARTAEQELFGALDSQQRVDAPLDEWSPKDVLAHLAAWRDRQVERIERVGRGEPANPNGNEPIDTINARLHAGRADWTWERADMEAEASAQRLSAAVQNADLDQLDEAGLVGSIVGNGPNHDLEHLPAIALLTGREDRVDQLVKLMTDAAQGGEFSDADAGTLIYNLACFATRDGRLDAARPLLTRAFELRPDLGEWAGEDSDLVPLRSELPGLIAAASPGRASADRT